MSFALGADGVIISVFACSGVKGMSCTTVESFTLRPAVIADFDSVLSLVIAQNMAGYGEPMVSADTLRKLWQSPNLDLGLDNWVAVAPDGQVAGYAELQHYSPTQLGLSIYLAREHQRKDIGVHLLQLAETRAARCSVDESVVVLISRVSELDQTGKQVVEEAGYNLGLSFLMMERILAEPLEPVQWAPGITVRAFMPGQDEQATYLADEEAAEDKGYHSALTFEEWAKRMSLDGADFDPTLWFLACRGEEIAGVALNFYSRATGAGWIDHLGVRRRWRNRGIGKGLLLHSFGEFHRRGIDRAKLSVDSKSLTNAPRLYERAGMHTVQQYHVYRKEIITSQIR
jgi:GNAT superfamily N-acetyltransferase